MTMEPMNSDCHSLVIEYLIHGCFKNTAKALLKETSKLENCCDLVDNSIKLNNIDLDNEQQWALLDARKSLTQSILQGNIPLAFDLISQHFPTLAAIDISSSALSSANDTLAVDLHLILFKLKCQRFIEIIRSSSPSSEIEAIRYAQTHLKATNNLLKEKVKEVTALIAYANPHESQFKYLLSQERREILANEVNLALLALCNLPKESSIEKIKKQYTLVEEELDKNNTVTEQNHREKIAM
ncbi:CTLH/CRA C-terminal to lish motif domain-containing protein [Pilobolus umbonatus]|nr:CTLH/CRA C-terminal to lish motif domain-containing protein [Pilobolus umbonatus]